MKLISVIRNHQLTDSVRERESQRERERERDCIILYVRDPYTRENPKEGKFQHTVTTMP